MIRILVVDDSVVVRNLVTRALSADPQVEVVGTAASGRIALAMVSQLSPDLVTMDLEMPDMNGIETVRALRRRGDRFPIIMFTSNRVRDAKDTFDALAAGATDFVNKPSSMISAEASLEQVAQQLLPRIRALVTPAGARPAGSRTPGSSAAAQSGDEIRLAVRPVRPVRPVQVVVIGSSMGGPEALSHILRGIPRLPVPVVLVQHMPPVFTRQLATRLNRLCASTVLESAGSETLEPGHVYIAPGDHHLELRTTKRGLSTSLHQGPQVNFSRPSIDVLFQSAVTACAGDLLAVVLTGMGSDGRQGCEAVVAAGGTVLAQNEASSVVWGIPGAVVKSGLAHMVLPLDQIANAIVAEAQRLRPVSPAIPAGAP